MLLVLPVRHSTLWNWSMDQQKSQAPFTEKRGNDGSSIFFPAILSGLFALKIIVSNYLFPRISVCPRKREKVNIYHLFYFCQEDMGSLQPLDTNNLLRGGEIIGAHSLHRLQGDFILHPVNPLLLGFGRIFFLSSSSDVFLDSPLV